jgi:hypothetical protein
LLSKSLFGISRTSEQTPEKLFFFNQTEQRQIENNVKYLKSHLACLLLSGWTWFPMMYLLHLHPKLATANNDISEIKVVNNAVVGYVNEGNKLWSSDDSLHISYPGMACIFK